MHSKKGALLISNHLTWLWTCHTIHCCAPRVRFFTHFCRISWTTEHGRLEAKENLTEAKVPMPTSVQLFAGKRGHFHTRWFLCSIHVVLQGCLHRKNYMLRAFSSHIGNLTLKGDYWIEFVVWKKMVILCVFVSLYRTFVIKQDETQRTVQRMTTSPAEELCFFFNWDGECQNHIVLNETLCVYKSSDEDSWWGINEPMPLSAHNTAVIASWYSEALGGSSVHLSLFKLAIAQSQNETPMRRK